MKYLFLLLLGLSCSVTWLVLLVQTGFNVVTVSAGLLGALYVEGRSSAATRE